MIKYLLFAFTALLLLASCSDTDNVDASDDGNNQEDNFTIIGSVSDAPNTTFYLEAQSQQGTINIALATSDAQGKFKMIGNVPGLGMYQLRMGDAPDKVILLTLVPGDELTLSATSATYATNPTASGTKWAKVMGEYLVQVTKFRDEQNKLVAMQSEGSLSNEEIQEKYLVLKNDIDEFALSRLKSDPGNPFNIVLSTYAVPSMDFQGWNPESLDILRNVASAFTKNYPNSPISSTLSNQVYQIEIAYNQHVANNSGTRVAPEIALNDPNGQEIRLSSLRGKVVLVDFWASWCAPCRRESPNVVRMYNKYKDQGFTVYSVSLDNNADAWKAAIAKDGLAWPNHVSDLLQWNSPMPQLYGFNGIPYTVLVNEEGMIIGTGLRGDALEQKLKEIFEN